MDAVAEPAIVIDGGAGIDDRRLADRRCDVDDGAGDQHRTVADRYVGADDRARMGYRRQPGSGRGQPLMPGEPRPVVADRHDRAAEFARPGKHVGGRAHDRPSRRDVGAGRDGIVEEADLRPPGGGSAIGHHLAVAAGAEDCKQGGYGWPPNFSMVAEPAALMPSR